MLWHVFRPRLRLGSLGGGSPPHAPNWLSPIRSNKGPFTDPYPPIKKAPKVGPFLLADREGFEPSNGFHRYTLSRRAPSTTRPPVRTGRGEIHGPVRPRKSRLSLFCKRL